MKICVCGYYYKPEFFSVMEMVNDKYPVYVVANKTWPTDDIPEGIERCERENLGLEWGAYNHYLHHVWDGVSDVLFLHDDVKFRPVIKDYEVMNPVAIFNAIDRLEHDQVYLFESLEKAERNYFIHGRAFKCSARFLEKLLNENGGFPFDPDNDGHIQGPNPGHCKHFNYADYKFADYIKSIQGEWEIGSYVIVPPLELGTRGRFDIELEGPIKE